jgi:hypothetical protein
MAYRAEADLYAESRFQSTWSAIRTLLEYVSKTDANGRPLIETRTLGELRPLYETLQEAMEWGTNPDTRKYLHSLEDKLFKEVEDEGYDEIGIYNLEEEVGDVVEELAEVRQGTGAPLAARASIVDAVFAAHAARAARAARARR